MVTWFRTHSLLSLLVTVGLAMAGAVGIAYLVHCTAPREILNRTNDVAGNYLQTLGTIYGVLLAFVVFVVWTQKNEANKRVEEEADGLRDIVRLSHAIGGPVRARILRAIDAYAVAVIEHEWPAMQTCSSSPEASQRLRELWEIVESIEPRQPREQCLYAETIRSFNALGDARADRLVSSGTRLPVSLRLFVLFGGACMVGSMCLFAVEPFWPLGLMVAVMAGAVSHILCLIHDLDAPYGDWQVTSSPIERVRRKVLKELEHE